MTTNKKTSLGRGLDSLIPTDLIQKEFDPTHEQDKKISHSKRIPISDIKPDPDQPRRAHSEESLRELAQSIGTHGILQPILVVSGVNGEPGFMIVAGERRWRAAQMAGLEHVPALVRNVDDQTKLEVALIENVQREDLSPLELATAFVKLSDQFKLSEKDISKRVGKAPSTVANIKRLIRLPDAAKRALANLRITEQHARAILSLDGDPKKQQELLDLILRHKWTAVKAEQYVKAYKDGATTVTEAVRRTMSETPETKVISKKLGAKVTIRHMANGGRLQITFKDGDDLDRITKLLG